jgi:eukaryotic-like serine/threonine-protein kinase
MTRIPGPLSAGTELAPGYEAIAHLSRGRALDVYDAWSHERQCRCVVKVVRLDRESERGPRRRLRREGRLLLALSHPHLVRAYELVERPQLALVLETIEGETVEHLVARRERRLPVSELAFLGLHMCSAVHYLHGNGYLHLDLKPSNVVADAGLAKVIDLSLARRPGRVARGVGTRQYLSPEQARGGRVGPPTDVWGIGAVLFEAASGRRPFPDSNGRFEQLARRAEPLSAHRRAPVEFRRLVDDCLDPDPANRPTVEKLARELESLVKAI